MYQYDQYDQTIVDERVAQYRDQVRRRLSGELSEDEFRPLRLQNGLYMQRHAYMLRIAIPYGNLRSNQLRMLARIAREHDRGYGHFSTRQNIQFNWIELEDTPEILAKLASVQMHASRPPATASATSPPTSSPASRRTRRSIRVRGPRSCVSGRRSIPNSRSCRASSRSPSPARTKTAPPCRSTTSASI
jgi:hypothetical protein